MISSSFLLWVVWFNFFVKWESFMKLLLVYEMLIIVLLLKFSVSSFSVLYTLFFLFVGVLEAIIGLSLLIFLLRFSGKPNMLFF